ncbi:MAG: NPCBM/NEW2 domain-containing protein [Deltaproteobacteria bacterium]|nr:NPCBM/NEW2 domain-containing protein [Deltaproteobacteria bacterium]
MRDVQSVPIRPRSTSPICRGRRRPTVRARRARSQQRGWAAGDGAPIRDFRRRGPHEGRASVHAFSEISVALDGRYDRFRAQIGLDDAQEPLRRGMVQFEVARRRRRPLARAAFRRHDADRVRPRRRNCEHALTLRIFTLGDACGDRGDWADARLVPKPAPGFRYYRFRPTKLRNDATASGIQLCGAFASFRAGCSPPCALRDESRRQQPRPGQAGRRGRRRRRHAVARLQSRRPRLRHGRLCRDRRLRPHDGERRAGARSRSLAVEVSSTARHPGMLTIAYC